MSVQHTPLTKSGGRDLQGHGTRASALFAVRGRILRHQVRGGSKGCSRAHVAPDFAWVTGASSAQACAGCGAGTYLTLPGEADLDARVKSKPGRRRRVLRLLGCMERKARLTAVGLGRGGQHHCLRVLCARHLLIVHRYDPPGNVDRLHVRGRRTV